MTPEEINRAIAEKCGWRFDGVKLFDQRGNLRAKTTIIAETGSVHPIWICAPNYFGDLNAMHESWLTLNHIQRTDFANHLSSIIANKPWIEECYLGSSSNPGIEVIINATAPQRAEAFLRTFGLWKEDGR